MKTYWTVTGILLLGFLLAACGGSPVTSPSNEGTGDSTLSGPDRLDLDDQKNLVELPENYTVAMDFVFTTTQADGTPLESSWRLDGVSQTDPPSSRYTYTGSGAANIQGSGIFEATYIGDQSYFYTSQMGCINMGSSSSVSPFSTMMDTGGMLANEAQRVQPDEIINGVPAYHFVITQDNLDLSDPTAMDIRELTHGAIYIAKEGGHILRLQLSGRGVSSLLSNSPTLEGDISYQLDFTPVPSVGSITPPEGCAGATESDFPVMSNAENQSTFLGFLSYQSSSGLEEVLDFYRSEMDAAGWSLTSESVMANVGMMHFSLGDRSASLIVTFDSAQGISSVVIAEE